MARIAAAAAVLLAGAFVADEALAFRMIQNTTVGRVSAGYAVTCDAPGGFTPWGNASIPWYHNTAGKGSDKAAALQSGLARWQAHSAPHNPTYAGTTTKGWATDGTNTVLWAKGNGCSGTCLALTALVLQSGQVIVETDVTFNSKFAWNTNGSNYDTEAVWVHELGHTLGFHHTEQSCSGSTTTRPTMCGAYFGVEGRTPQSDDNSALSCSQSRYPL
jgi:hypothetical protein